MRQGGVLLPQLFAIYMDDLSVCLTQCKAGCHLNESVTNHNMFGAMHFNYYINRSINMKEGFNLLGLLTNSTQRICLVASGGCEPVTFRSLSPMLFNMISLQTHVNL